jgi:uncharacterized membrane protein YkvA (DUF1232 family)
MEDGRIAQIARQGRLVLRLMGDRRVPTALKLIPLVAFGYLIFPLDADFIPIAGQLDDLAVILIAMRLFIQLAPRDIVDQLERQASVTTSYRVHEED